MKQTTGPTVLKRGHQTILEMEVACDICQMKETLNEKNDKNHQNNICAE